MALTPQKVSDMAAATTPIANTAQVYLVQGANSRRATVGELRRLPAYTVASLPSPATAGAGALAWASDAAGGAVPVYCDGSDWKRFDTNAVVT